MAKKIIFKIVLIVLFSLIQIAFIKGLPRGFNDLNFVLITLIFILSLEGLGSVMPWVLGVGFIMDLFSFGIFGANLLSLFLVMLIINFLLKNFFTNRSLYSFLALTFFSTVLYRLFTYSYSYIIYSFIGREVGFIEFYSLGRQVLLNLLALLIIFYFFNFLSKKLKPMFLIKG